MGSCYRDTSLPAAHANWCEQKAHYRITPTHFFYALLMAEVKQLRTALYTVSSQQGKLQGNYYYCWKAVVQNKVNKPLLNLPRENNFHLLHHYKALLLNLATEMISLPSHINVLATGPGGRSG